MMWWWPFAALALSIGLGIGFEVGMKFERRRWRDLLTCAYHENWFGKPVFCLLARHWMKDGRFTLFDEAQAEAAHKRYQTAWGEQPHGEA